MTDRIAIVIPVLNEAAHIAACLADLAAQAGDAEILVLDGGSSDGTQAIVAARAVADPRIRLVHNPKRLQAAAMNLGARIAAPDVTILLRADAHAFYPAGFVARCAEALRAQGATSVVVPMRTVGASPLQRAIASVQNSRLGNGGSAHRAGGVSGFVDHGHHAAFDRAFFRAIGGYDETFSHNEDAEHDVRAHKAGGRVWMCREAAIDYFPRTRLWPLARQYARHGAGRARTLLKHALWPRPRQMAAPAILIACLLGLLLAPLDRWSLAVPLLYLLACTGFAMATAVRLRDPVMIAMAPAAMAVHLGWAVGFFRTLALHAWRPQRAG